MLRAASVRAWVNTISTSESDSEVQSIDDPISFPPLNLIRAISPHYDALMLTLCINNFDVHRLLVDLGSAADLLHLPTFQLQLDHLSSADRVLSGFNGATTLTVGDIFLPVKVGPVTHQVLFSVVENLGPYNGIMGWA